MTRVIRAALTQTLNQYADMPAAIADLPQLKTKLDDIREANVAHHIDLLEVAAQEGAQVIGFGELFAAPYFAPSEEPMWLDFAEPLDGPTVSRLQEAARKNHIVVVAPMYEFDPSSGKRFNTAVVIDADGERLGFYTKTHIPHGENEEGVFSEGFYFEPSTGRPNPHPKNVSRNPFFPVFDTEAGRIGVAICYDRHFDGVMSTLRSEGAEVVFSPAVTFGDKSERLWEHEFATDACRHRLFIGGSNRYGSERPWNQSFFGKSRFVGPEGILDNLRRHPLLVISECDLDSLTGRDPSGWNLRRDRRARIFTRAAGDVGVARPNETHFDTDDG